ncbi:MAG: hypothetical protein PHV78_00040 [Patescibacteria group bacterium]|nr:hypothetical protein [Patescibacteria group bacterium]MDD5121433.1 hypothetical protein [Patescibacteria group bacterium]MDD5222341.1 hypothetical protein [Patescibacteria group bacterium]MDD5395648.1 hypothetical protein [Patescibacteria group bacterium]
MTLKQYLNLMFICTLICWGVWVLSIFLVNPQNAGILGFVLFYLSLFLAILGSTALVGFLIRARLGKTPIFAQVSIAFRQGIWIALIIIFALLLQSFRLLRWWNVALFALLVIIIEVLILTNRRPIKNLE